MKKLNRLNRKQEVKELIGVTVGNDEGYCNDKTEKKKKKKKLTHRLNLKARHSFQIFIYKNHVSFSFQPFSFAPLCVTVR